MATEHLVKEITTSGSPYLGQGPKKLKALLYLDNDLVISSVIMIAQVMAFCITWTLCFIDTFTLEIQKKYLKPIKSNRNMFIWKCTYKINCICEDIPKSNRSNSIYKTFEQHFTSQSAEVSILTALKSIRSYKELYFQFKNLNWKFSWANSRYSLLNYILWSTLVR